MGTKAPQERPEPRQPGPVSPPPPPPARKRDESIGIELVASLSEFTGKLKAENDLLAFVRAERERWESERYGTDYPDSLHCDGAIAAFDAVLERLEAKP